MPIGPNGIEFLIAAIVFCVSGVMILLGLQVRGRGKTPYCRRCGYNLTGLVSNRCPECGTDVSIAANIQHGRPHRRWWLAAVGGLAMIALITWPIVSHLEIDWYRLRPTAWVIADTETQDARTAIRAWKELDRRLKDQQFEDHHYDQIIEIYLDQQTTPIDERYCNHSKVIDYATVAMQRGLWSDEQYARLWDQMFEASLEVRPVVSPHDDVPTRFSYKIHNQVLPIACRIRIDRLQLDGVPLDQEVKIGAEGSKGCGGHLDWIDVGQPEPGRHELTGRLSVEFYSSALDPSTYITRTIDWDNEDEWRHRELYRETSIELRSTFEVLTEDRSDYIQTVESDLVEPWLNTRCRFGLSIQRDREGVCRIFDRYTFTGPVKALPLNVAADVYLRMGDWEARVGKAMWQSGVTTSPYRFSNQFTYTGPAVETGALIVRSNDQLVRDSIETYGIWEGEAVHENVPIKWTKDEFDEP
jgi:hypothetical protein